MKPEIRIIEDQSEQTNTNVPTKTEIDYLLSKYGYISQDTNTQNQQQTSIYSNMTFDEFSKINDDNYRDKILAEQNRRHLPKAYTFDNVNYSESKYNTLDLDGHNLGIQIQITSDMQINNPRRL